jgi:hypothetical protein
MTRGRRSKNKGWAEKFLIHGARSGVSNRVGLPPTLKKRDRMLFFPFSLFPLFNVQAATIDHYAIPQLPKFEEYKKHHW